jgi:hypothetical protein
MEPPAGPPKLPWFRNGKKLILLGVILSVVIIVPTVVYYELGYNSVNGTHPELVTGYRSASYFSATFYITVHVWSWAGSLDTQVTSPAFTLTANNLPFGTQIGTSGTFSPNNYVAYTLTFTTSDSAVASSIRSSNTTYLVLQMSADVSSGWYHQLISRSDSASWTFG